MPGTTPNLALPTMLGSDPLGTVDDRITALATALDTYLRPRSVSGIVAGEVTSVSGVFAYRCGPLGVVSVNVTTDATGVAADGVLFTLPSGFRPPIDFWQAELIRAIAPPEQPLRVTVNMNGFVRVGPAVGASEIIRGSFFFPIAGA